METSSKEDFAGINVVDSSDVSLVKEEIFGTFRTPKKGKESWEREVWGKRVNTKPFLEGLSFFKEEDFPKFP